MLVGDEVGAAQAIRLAGRVPEAVEALALGHPALSLRSDGDRAPLSGDVADAVVQLAHTDSRSFVRALTQLTQNAYDDELAELYMERVGPSMVAADDGRAVQPRGAGGPGADRCARSMCRCCWSSTRAA